MDEFSKKLGSDLLPYSRTRLTDENKRLLQPPPREDHITLAAALQMGGRLIVLIGTLHY